MTGVLCYRPVAGTGKTYHSGLITGAVALHTFAEIIRNQYNQAIDIVIEDAFRLPPNSPVQEILKTLENPYFIRMGS